MSRLGADLGGRRVLVTGASGFLGSHLTRRLTDEGADVHILVRKSGGRRLDDLAPSVREHVADVTDITAVSAAVQRAHPEVVFHLAAETRARGRAGDWTAARVSMKSNLLGTMNVLHAALEAGALQRFVRAGSLEEYGNGPTPYDEGQREQPVSPYSASQVAAVHYCQMLQSQTQAAIVTLRPTLVYGPSQSTDFFVPGVIAACLVGEDFEMSSGHQRRDLLYVDDAVDAFVRAAATDGLHGAVVNLGSGEAFTLRAVAERIARLVGGSARILVGRRPDRPGEIAQLLGATERAGQLLAWRSETSLSEGLARTVAWYRANVFERTR